MLHNIFISIISTTFFIDCEGNIPETVCHGTDIQILQDESCGKTLVVFV